MCERCDGCGFDAEGQPCSCEPINISDEIVRAAVAKRAEGRAKQTEWKATHRARPDRPCRCGQAMKAVGFDLCNECQRDRMRLRNHGVTREQHDEMLYMQGGRCQICRTDDPGGKGSWHTDHDHDCCPGKTSRGDCFRGLLCAPCNSGLGFFRDDPARLREAAVYIERWQAERRDAERLAEKRPAS